MWKDKTKLDSVEKGDCNSGFFYASLKAQRAMSNVNLFQPNGEVMEDKDVGHLAASYFQSLLGTCHTPVYESQFNFFEKIVSEEENNALVDCPTLEEIRAAIVTMNPTSSPGPDGFTGRFYVACWDIIKHDLYDAVRAFFLGEHIPPIISATHITLIPKVPNATNLNQLRPISLCNVIHKIISTILNGRLVTLLPRLISEEQAGFMHGRNIHEHIALAHDLVQDLKTKTFGGNIMIKLDMSKAYDRISWSFILSIFRAAGFSEAWCDIILRCINNSWYSVKWGGQCYGFFKSYCGVRQGDPLSPSLFLVAMEWFSKAIKVEIEEGFITPYYSGRNIKPVSHLLFADDMLVFSNGHKRSLDFLMKIIDTFCNFSGQQLNKEKSSIFFSTHIPAARRQAILESSHFSQGHFPTMYLGAPLFIGSPRISYFMYLEDKVRRKICGWTRNFLSMGGRLALINSVLNSMALHCMAVLPVPKAIIRRISTLISNFLWDQGTQRRRHWVNWETVCKPKASGGLGVLSLHDLMNSMQARVAWRCISQNSLWASHMENKYGAGRKKHAVWKNLSVIIDRLKGQSRWILGDGLTSVNRFCSCIGISAPSGITQTKIKDVFLDPDARNRLLDNMPSPHREHYESYTQAAVPDRLIWTGSSMGNFSSKAYRVSITNHHATIQWGSLIWQPWIPSKVSCFVWKFILNGVPTDMRIKDTSIPLASKCSCCGSNEESTTHLFFFGNWGKALWGFLSNIFNKRQPLSTITFIRDWLGHRPPSTLKDGLRIGAACFGIWEIWKARNSSRFEGRKNNIIHGVLNSLRSSCHLINLPHEGSDANDRWLLRLGIRPPSINVSSSRWNPWLPCSFGWTGSVALVHREGSFSAGIVIRDHKGELALAICCCIDVVHGVHGLLRAFSHTIESCLARRLWPVTIQSSSIFLGDLFFASEMMIPWDLIFERRRFRRLYGNVPILRVNAALNSAAINLAYQGAFGSFSRANELPPSVTRALVADKLGLPYLCHIFRSE